MADHVVNIRELNDRDNNTVRLIELEAEHLVSSVGLLFRNMQPPGYANIAELAAHVAGELLDLANHLQSQVELDDARTVKPRTRRKPTEGKVMADIFMAPDWLSDTKTDTKRKFWCKQNVDVVVFLIRGVEDGELSINNARALLGLKPLGKRRKKK